MISVSWLIVIYQPALLKVNAYFQKNNMLAYVTCKKSILSRYPPDWGRGVLITTNTYLVTSE